MQYSHPNEVPHEVDIEVRLSKPRNKVLNTKCSCLAGQGCCKHIISTCMRLFKINLNELEPISCTDLRQKWGKASMARRSKGMFKGDEVRKMCHFKPKQFKDPPIPDTFGQFVRDAFKTGDPTCELSLSMKREWCINRKAKKINTLHKSVVKAIRTLTKSKSCKVIVRTGKRNIQSMPASTLQQSLSTLNPPPGSAVQPLEKATMKTLVSIKENWFCEEKENLPPIPRTPERFSVQKTYASLGKKCSQYTVKEGIRVDDIVQARPEQPALEQICLNTVVLNIPSGSPSPPLDRHNDDEVVSALLLLGAQPPLAPAVPVMANCVGTTSPSCRSVVHPVHSLQTSQDCPCLDKENRSETQCPPRPANSPTRIGLMTQQTVSARVNLPNVTAGRRVPLGTLQSKVRTPGAESTPIEQRRQKWANNSSRRMPPPPSRVISKTLCRLLHQNLPVEVCPGHFQCPDDENYFFKNICVTAEEADKLFFSTTGQSRSNEWRAARRRRFTGSICYKLFTPKTSLNDKGFWRLKLKSLLEDKFQGNFNTRRGLIDESFARRRYEEIYSVSVEELGLLVHPDMPWFGFNADGIIGEDILFETKSPECGICQPAAEIIKSLPYVRRDKRQHVPGSSTFILRTSSAGVGVDRAAKMSSTLHSTIA